jgi:S1-C subfamily serine protease
MFLATLLLIAAIPANLEHRVLPVLGTKGTPVASATPLTKSILLTNAHVVDDNKTILVGCGDDLLVGDVVGVSKLHDLAYVILRSECALAEPSVPRPTRMPVGHQIWLVGYPLGEFAVKGGIVARYRNIQNAVDNAIDSGLTDSQCLPGNSGGVVLDNQGRMVGIVFGRLCAHLLDGSSCEGTFVPSDVVLKFLSDTL